MINNNISVNIFKNLNKNQMKKYYNSIYKLRKNLQKMKIKKNNYNKHDMIMKVLYIKLKI